MKCMPLHVPAICREGSSARSRSGVGLSAMLPRLADAADTTDAEVEIKTPDGVCDAYIVHPAKGRHPAVLIWPDIFGLRTAFRQMGKRLAESASYTVLVINPFYRTKKAPTAPDHPDFSDPATRATLMQLAGTLSPATALTDASAFVGYLDAHPAVDKKEKDGHYRLPYGRTVRLRDGGCVSRNGPERPATFHGGGLATDKPESPSLLIPKMKAHFLIAIAENDERRSPM